MITDEELKALKKALAAYQKKRKPRIKTIPFRGIDCDPLYIKYLIEFLERKPIAK